MKATAVIVIFIWLSLEGYSQPLLTTGCSPVNGETLQLFRIDTANLDGGGSGANQNWVFNFGVPGSPYATVTYGTAAGTAYAANFPTANLTASVAGTGVFMYYNSNADSLTLLGNGSAETVVVSANPSIIRKYPLQFTESFTDSVFASWSNGTMQNSGSRTTTYDGYGSLTVNGHVFNDVVRLYTVEHGVNTHGSRTVAVQAESYEWMKSSNGQMLMQITNTALDAGSGQTGQMQVVTVTSHALN